MDVNRFGGSGHVGSVFYESAAPVKISQRTKREYVVFDTGVGFNAPPGTDRRWENRLRSQCRRCTSRRGRVLGLTIDPHPFVTVDRLDIKFAVFIDQADASCAVLHRVGELAELERHVGDLRLEYCESVRPRVAPSETDVGRSAGLNPGKTPGNWAASSRQLFRKLKPIQFARRRPAIRRGKSGWR